MKLIWNAVPSTLAAMGPPWLLWDTPPPCSGGGYNVSVLQASGTCSLTFEETFTELRVDRGSTAIL